MDLRSVKPGLAAVSHPLFMIHPQTGEMLTPLGYTKAGRPVWPMMGGAPDDDEGNKGKKDDDSGSEDEDEDEDDESEEDDEDDSDDDDEGEEDEGDGKKKPKNAQAKIKALTEEKDRHYRKARKERKAREAAEAEVAALKAKYESGDDDEDDEDDSNKGKKKAKSTKIKANPDEAKIKAAEARAEKLAIENAFLRVNAVDWIKPEQALALMLADDDYEIEFDDDGKVDRKALKAELKRFAKDNPHLVKKAAPKDEDKESDEDDGARRATASRMNGKRKGSKKSDKEMSREELAKKFPALANRL